jgi:tRNA pseudouridine55 synthase
LDGILNINKPRGKTSFRVVALIRRWSGERHVGHAGTLDPDATGVLPVCLGRGTRIIEYLMDSTKAYRARIELGTATDTHDSSGKIVRQGDTKDINRDTVVKALEKFRGQISQTPPMFSALKHEGQPLYKLAREGISVARKARKVTIHRLEPVYWKKPVVTVDIECSKGTYVRSLAHDLGEYLGCGAHLQSLVRTRCGIFSIEDSASLTEIQRAFRNGKWQEYLHPIDSVLGDFPAVVIDSEAEEDFKNGKRLMPSQYIIESAGTDEKSRYGRAYASDGRFVGILQRTAEEGVWQPKKVMV